VGRAEDEGAVSVESVDTTLLDDVCSRVREQLSDDDAARAEAFVRQYYRWVAPEDLAERDPLDVYGLALAHFNLARRRRPGTTKVRVYNPQFEEHGWQSSHTAVEVVTDDMPFLTDSVTAELNRRGFRVHLIIHPVVGVKRDAEGDLVEDDGRTEGLVHPFEVDQVQGCAHRRPSIR
jgi:glutamate dehydrogenase